MKTINKLSILFVLGLVSVFPFVKIKAVSVTPSSGSYAPNAQVTLNVVAATGGNTVNAVTLRLAFTNATVVSFTPVSGGSWVGAIADCAGSVHYTTTTVCSSLAKSTNIVNGETLGTLVIQFSNTPGTATITKSSGNAYSDGSTSFANTGTAATYTISSSATSLPNTAFVDGQSSVILLVSGLLVLTGLALIKVKPFSTIE